jgi:hypothetical protein
VQRTSTFTVLRARIGTMLEQHVHELDRPVHCRSVQRSSAFFVLQIYLRTMLQQHACDLDPHMIRHLKWVHRIVHHQVHRGPAFFVLWAYIRTMLKQHVHDLDLPMNCRSV